MLLLLYLTAAVTARSASDQLPHCSRTTVMEGQISDYDDATRQIKKFNAIQLSMVLHETACIELQMANSTETTMLHSLEYLRLEQHHPITGTYQFGIPRLTSNCFCDCYGGDSHCRINEYNYQNCSTPPLCYRTFHSQQSEAGCEYTSRKSDVCCQLKIEPYRQWTFTAIRINQPSTYLVIRYQIFERLGQSWRRTVQEIIEVPTNRGGAKFDLNSQHHVEIVVTAGRPNRELTPGMYFVRDGTNELRQGVELNDLKGADLSKLGWMRLMDGNWNVPNGPAKIKEKFHIDVQNCKEQRYTTTFNGRHVVFVTGDSENEDFELGTAISDDPWISSAHVGTREVKVEHAEGTAIMMHLTTESRPLAVRHSSQLETFSGTIRLDRESNRFLNITLFGAKGTVVGQVYHSESKLDVDMVFSVQVDSSISRDFTTVVGIPSNIESSRYVCLHPSGFPDMEVCKWCSYESQQLPSIRIVSPWHSSKGDKDKYNVEGIESFWESLNPQNLFDGVDGVKEALGLAINVAVIIVLALMFILCVTKCIYPLACCSLAVVRPLKK